MVAGAPTLIDGIVDNFGIWTGGDGIALIESLQAYCQTCLFSCCPKILNCNEMDFRLANLDEIKICLPVKL